MFPTVYYIPQNVTTQDQRGHLQPMQYMPSVVYQNMMYSHPFYQMQFPPTTSTSNINDSIYNSAFQFDKSNAVPVLHQKIPMPGSGSQFDNTSTFQRPPSQATSVKADIGSTSASVVNRVWIVNQRKKLHAPKFHSV